MYRSELLVTKDAGVKSAGPASRLSMVRARRRFGALLHVDPQAGWDRRTAVCCDVSGALALPALVSLGVVLGDVRVNLRLSGKRWRDRGRVGSAE